MNFNKKSMMFYFVFWGILLFILIGFFWILLKGVRILDYRAAMAAFEILPDYSDFVRFDPAREGGHLLPNINTVALGSRHGEIIRWITNSKGFRNDQEFDYFPSPGTFRILLLGDSFVDGMRTDQKSTIGAVLEKSLNASTRTDQYKHYEVMIAGHNNPALAWYYYQEYGAKYHPHLVILGVTLANDLTWQHYKIRVFPTIDADGLLFLQFAAEQEKISVSLDLPLPQEAYTPKHALREALQNMELRFRQYLARKSLYLFGYLVPPNLMKNDKTRQIPGRRELSAKDFGLSPGLFYQPIMPEIAKAYQDFEEVISGMYQRVEKNGSRFLIVLFPLHIQVAPVYWNRLTKYYSLDATKFDLTYPNQRIGAFCREKQIAYLDATDAFRQHYQQSLSPLFMPRGDAHYNASGQAVVSQLIETYILQQRR